MDAVSAAEKSTKSQVQAAVESVKVWDEWTLTKE